MPLRTLLRGPRPEPASALLKLHDMDKEEIVRRFRTWLYRFHGYGGLLSEEALKASRDEKKLYDELTSDMK